MQIASVLGIALIITGIFFIDEYQRNYIQDTYQFFYVITMILGGAYISSRAFYEYRNTANGFSYFMLPASTFEKFLVPALFSGIFYFLIYTLIYWTLAYFTLAFWSIVYSFDMQLLNPFTEQSGLGSNNMLLIFLFIQPIFLLGSIVFRKNHFISTGISLFIVFIVLFFLSMTYSKLVFGTTRYVDIVEAVFNKISIVNYIWVGLFHVLMLTASYFTLKEKAL
jgi:hypothetical protein